MYRSPRAQSRSLCAMWPGLEPGGRGQRLPRRRPQRGLSSHRKSHQEPDPWEGCSLCLWRGLGKGSRKKGPDVCSHLIPNTSTTISYPFTREEAKLHVAEVTKRRCGREWLEGNPGQTPGGSRSALYLSGDYTGELFMALRHALRTMLSALSSMHVTLQCSLLQRTSSPSCMLTSA